MISNNFSKILILFIFLYISIINASNENEFRRCEVFYEDKCILNDGTELKKGHRCATGEGYIYKGIDDFGKCEYEKYLVEYDDENIFNILRDDGEYDSIDELDSVNGNDDNYYIFADEECNALEDDNSIGYVCHCNDENDCTIVKENGYYIDNNNNIYSCVNNKNECSKVLAKENCSESNIGEIFYDSEDKTKYLLCLNYAQNKEYTVLLEAENAGAYIINYNDNNIFGLSNSKEFALVEIDKNSVILKKSSSGNIKYIYVNSEENRVLDKGLCPDDTKLIIELNCSADAICIENNEN